MAKQKTDLQVFQEWVQELTGLVFGESQQETERAKGFTKEHTEQWLKSVKDPQVKPKKRKRARKKDGTYRGDDKSTPNVNEAWENE